ncbi:HAD domain-containing protein [Streptomyces sp. NPDC053431]|uniref:HAD domain-containing protein n=1 Tax=Streptomyces sp. NPDC053431 TaxID=3365703 RepID=UPI0037D61BA2
MRPLLFLDVDGPLIPFGGPGPHPSYAPEPPRDAHPLLHRVDPAHGRRLLALGCEPVWATTWADEANDVLAPRLGLAPLPVVDWPEDEGEGEGESGGEGERAGGGGGVGVGSVGRLHWKTRPLVGRAAGRPFVWLDDEITEADRRWVALHHPAPALLRRVDPRTGLTDADYAAVVAWVGEYGDLGE